MIKYFEGRFISSDFGNFYISLYIARFITVGGSPNKRGKTRIENKFFLNVIDTFIFLCCHFL